MEFVAFLSYVLSGLGLAVLLVWPQSGPSAWVRERLLRPALGRNMVEILDCYICCGFWSGLALSPVWWLAYRRLWCWSGCLIVPYLFWLSLGNGSSKGT